MTCRLDVSDAKWSKCATYHLIYTVRFSNSTLPPILGGSAPEGAPGPEPSP